MSLATGTARPGPAGDPARHPVRRARGRLVHNRAKAVHLPGPDAAPPPGRGRRHLLLRHEAAARVHGPPAQGRGDGAGSTSAELAEIPSYVPGELPTVPGHEVAGRIVAVGSAVTRHAVGERVLVQTDYRHLPTPGSNAAFGYNFEGGLQEYVLLDERMIIEPGTGERFLIPVGEAPSGSAVALLEPWACVEASYACRSGDTLAPGGRLLVVADAGHAVDGLDPLLAARAAGARSSPRARTRPSATRHRGRAVGAATARSALEAAATSTTLAPVLLRRHRLLRRRPRPDRGAPGPARDARRHRRRAGRRAGSGGPWRSTSGASTTTSLRWVGTPGERRRRRLRASRRPTASCGPVTGSP